MKFIFLKYNKYILSGSNDKKVIIWNSNTFEYERTLAEFNDSVLSIVNSDTYLAIGLKNNQLLIYNQRIYVNLETLLSEVNNSAVFSLEILTDSNIVSGHADGSIKIWNGTTFELITTLKVHSDTVYALAILPNSSSIVTGSLDKSIKIWKSKDSYELIAILNGHNNSVLGLAVMANSNLVSCSQDTTIKLWNSTSFKLISKQRNENNIFVSILRSKYKKMFSVDLV